MGTLVDTRNLLPNFASIQVRVFDALFSQKVSKAHSTPNCNLNSSVLKQTYRKGS